MRTHVYVDGFNFYHGCVKGTPFRWLDFSDSDLADPIRLGRDDSGLRDGLHWDSLDVDVSLKGLMMRALNLREWAPRILGQIRSEAKARAARENGRKGGRPRIRPRPKKGKAGSLEG